jgi:hypothetical protein
VVATVGALRVCEDDLMTRRALQWRGSKDDDVNEQERALYHYLSAPLVVIDQSGQQREESTVDKNQNEKLLPLKETSACEVPISDVARMADMARGSYPAGALNFSTGLFVSDPQNDEHLHHRERAQCFKPVHLSSCPASVQPGHKLHFVFIGDSHQRDIFSELCRMAAIEYERLHPPPPAPSTTTTTSTTTTSTTTKLLPPESAVGLWAMIHAQEQPTSPPPEFPPLGGGGVPVGQCAWATYSRDGIKEAGIFAMDFVAAPNFAVSRFYPKRADGELSSIEEGLRAAAARHGPPTHVWYGRGAHDILRWGATPTEFAVSVDEAVHHVLQVWHELVLTDKKSEDEAPAGALSSGSRVPADVAVLQPDVKPATAVTLRALPPPRVADLITHNDNDAVMGDRAGEPPTAASPLSPPLLLSRLASAESDAAANAFAMVSPAAPRRLKCLEPQVFTLQLPYFFHRRGHTRTEQQRRTRRDCYAAPRIEAFRAAALCGFAHGVRNTAVTVTSDNGDAAASTTVISAGEISRLRPSDGEPNESSTGAPIVPSTPGGAFDAPQWVTSQRWMRPRRWTAQQLEIGGVEVASPSASQAGADHDAGGDGGGESGVPAPSVEIMDNWGTTFWAAPNAIAHDGHHYAGHTLRVMAMRLLQSWGCGGHGEEGAGGDAAQQQRRKSSPVVPSREYVAHVCPLVARARPLKQSRRDAKRGRQLVTKLPKNATPLEVLDAHLWQRVPVACRNL